MGEISQAMRKAFKHPMIDMLLAGVKASGGYKYREHIQLGDVELTAFVAGAEAKIREMAKRLRVAEAMLREQPPSYHARWEEYQERCREATGTGSACAML